MAAMWGWLTGKPTRLPLRAPSTADVRSSLLEARSIAASDLSEDDKYVQRKIRDNPMWTLDRGSGWYQSERKAKKKASLLGSGP